MKCAYHTVKAKAAISKFKKRKLQEKAIFHPKCISTGQLLPQMTSPKCGENVNNSSNIAEKNSRNVLHRTNQICYKFFQQFKHNFLLVINNSGERKLKFEFACGESSTFSNLVLLLRVICLVT